MYSSRFNRRAFVYDLVGIKFDLFKMKDRFCIECGTLLVKRANEHIALFKKRKLCNKKCSMNYMRKNKIGWYGNDW